MCTLGIFLPLNKSAKRHNKLINNIEQRKIEKHKIG